MRNGVIVAVANAILELTRSEERPVDPIEYAVTIVKKKSFSCINLYTKLSNIINNMDIIFQKIMFIFVFILGLFENECDRTTRTLEKSKCTIKR